MDKLRLYQFIETLRITGTNSGTTTVMTGVSTGRCSGTSWVENVSYRLLGVYVNFVSDGTTTRTSVNSGVSIVMRSGKGRAFDTILVEEKLGGENGLTFEPTSEVILPPGDDILVNLGRTDSDGADAYCTIHIGY